MTPFSSPGENPGLTGDLGFLYFKKPQITSQAGIFPG
jgi:hypothetical protein